MELRDLIFAESYIVQAIGFVAMSLAWCRAAEELANGPDVPRTRKILFAVATVAIIAYVTPAILSVCYFIPGCSQPAFRDYLRVSSGHILFLFGLFMFLLYYTKEVDSKH